MKATRKKNPYRAPKGFVPNPFTPLYQEPDVDPSEDLSVQEILDYALTLEDQIPGDFSLSQVVNEIKSNSLSFVRTGLLAYKVKVYKIYRNVHRNFKEFCEKALGVSHWQINRNIEAARVVVELAQNGFDILPKCEAQCRPLSKFSGAELCANWQSVLDTTPPHRITGKAINEALGIETNSECMRISPKAYYIVKKKALEVGISVDKLLIETFGDDTSTQFVDQRNLDEWEEDLQALVDEQEKVPSQETEDLNEQDGELVNKEASNEPASDVPPMQPGLNTESIPKDFEASSVVINGFGIQAQSGLLTNLYNPESLGASHFGISTMSAISKSYIFRFSSRIDFPKWDAPESFANWQTFLDANPVRKINSNAIDKVLDMEREYEYLEVSEELYHLLHEKAHAAGMSIDELILKTFGNQTSTDEGGQAAQKKPKRRSTKHKRGFGTG